MSNLPAIRNTGDDYAGLMALAKELVTTGFLPQAIKTPAQAVAIILTGKELGIPPMQSLRSICIIQGKPELSADLQLSIFHRDGGRSKWLELTAIVAKVLLKHPNGDEHTETFTMEDAKRAGLAGGVNWQKYPKAMLRSRAITAGLKSIGFEPLTGAYAPGEIGGPEVVDVEPKAIVEQPEDNPNPEPTPEPTTEAKPKKSLTVATANTRAAALDRLGCQEEGVAKNTLHAYLVALGWLENERSVEQWPIRFVPITADELEAVKVGMAAFSLDGKAVMPYPPHGMDPGTLQPKPVKSPKSEPAWKSFVMPYGVLRGTPIGKIPKEDLLSLCNTFVVRETINDMSVAPEHITSQKALRAALDEAAAHFANQPTTKG